MARGDLHSHASNHSALSHLGHLEISFKGLINQKNFLLIALVSELSALKHFDLMQHDKMVENYFWNVDNTNLSLLKSLLLKASHITVMCYKIRNDRSICWSHLPIDTGHESQYPFITPHIYLKSTAARELSAFQKPLRHDSLRDCIYDEGFQRMLCDWKLMRCYFVQWHIFCWGDKWPSVLYDGQQLH